MKTHGSIQYLRLQSEAVFDKIPIKVSSDHSQPTANRRQPTQTCHMWQGQVTTSLPKRVLTPMGSVQVNRPMRHPCGILQEINL